jgi:hypothetical protein
MKTAAFVLVAAVAGYAAGFIRGEPAGEGRAYGTVTSWQVQTAGKSSLQPNLKAGRNPAVPPGL